MRFEIEGLMWAQPVPLNMYLQTDIDLETGEVEVVRFTAFEPQRRITDQFSAAIEIEPPLVISPSPTPSTTLPRPPGPDSACIRNNRVN